MQKNVQNPTPAWFNDDYITNNSKVITRNTFLPESTKHVLGMSTLKAILFTGLPTFASWQLFGKLTLPKVAEKLNEDTSFGAASGRGQALVGTALAYQIISIFSLVDIARAIFEDIEKNFGKVIKNKNNIINKLILKNSQELLKYAEDQYNQKLITKEEYGVLKNSIKEAKSNTLLGSPLFGKLRNMFFQGVEDGTAAFSEVSHEHAFGEQFQEFRDRNAGSILAWIPEVLREIYNGVQKNDSSYVGSTKKENVSFLNAISESLENFENIKNPLNFHGKRLVLAPLRGAMRGLHYTISVPIMDSLGLKRGQFFPEIIYQATRNGLFQQLPWQVGKLAIDELCKKISDKKMKKFYILDLEDKLPDPNVNLIEDGVDGVFIKKDAVVQSISSLDRDLAKIKQCVDEINPSDEIKNSFKTKDIESIHLTGNRDIANKYLDKIIEYEKHWQNKELSKSEKERINKEIVTRFENITEYIDKASLLLLNLKKTANKSNNPDEICDIIEYCQQLESDIKNRFGMLFPTGCFNEKLFAEEAGLVGFMNNINNLNAQRIEEQNLYDKATTENEISKVKKELFRREESKLSKDGDIKKQNAL